MAREIEAANLPLKYQKWQTYAPPSSPRALYLSYRPSPRSAAKQVDVFKTNWPARKGHQTVAYPALHGMSEKL